MPYATQADLLAIVDERILVAYSAAPGVATVDEGKLDAAILAASERADNLLAEGFAVPLPEPYPALVVTAVAQMALFLLLKRPDELRRQNYDDAVKDLRTYARNRKDPEGGATAAGTPGSTTEGETYTFAADITDYW